MTRTKKTNPDQPDIFAQLRAAEAEEFEVTADSYNVMVSVLAADPNALDIDEVQRVCLASGKSASDLERHVRMIRPFATGQARRAEEEIESAQAEVGEIGEARQALRAALNGKLPDEATTRKFDALSRRLAQVLARIKAARKQLVEFENNQAALRAELRGEPVPEPVKAAPPTPTVEVTSTPSQTSRPAKYDQYDPNWQMHWGPGGIVYYTFKGQRVSA